MPCRAESGVKEPLVWRVIRRVVLHSDMTNYCQVTELDDTAYAADVVPRT